MSNYTKADFAAELALRLGVKQPVAKEIFNIFQDIIVENLENGLTICLDQLGKFKKITKPARVGRNPKTGEKMQIAEKQVITFKRKK